jgi:hypothetical protein
VETGRAVFRAVRLLRYKLPASEYVDDTPEDTPEDFATWLYSEVAKLDVLEGFNKWIYMWFPPIRFKGLSFEERACVLNSLQKGETAKATLAEMEKEAAEFEALMAESDRLLRDAALILAGRTVSK